MRIYKTVHKKNVSEISSEVKEYQRPIEPIRLNNIKKSMTEDGYWPQEALVLNQDNECVDGQHRLQAAKDLGVEEIPCVIYHFDTIQEEAKMFNTINSFNTKLKPVDQWHSKLIWGCPIAKMVYRLNDDPQSPFYKKIKVKGNTNGTHKLTIPSIIQLMNTLMFNLRAPHYKNSDNLNSKMTNRFKDMDWDEAIRRGALFMQFFKEFADDNPKWYTQPSIPPIAIIYKSLKEQGKFDNPRKIPLISQKLKNFDIDNKDWKNSPRSTKINMISSHLIRQYRAFLSDFDPFKGSTRQDNN